ncbi:hypothetical protein Csa_005352 [Cucumis sativus]|nr:hypothetical protein Csa_005352 [Cucumis sativus]
MSSGGRHRPFRTAIILPAGVFTPPLTPTELLLNSHILFINADLDVDPLWSFSFGPFLFLQRPESRRPGEFHSP